MHITLHLGVDASITIDAGTPHSIAIPMDFEGPQPSAFGLGRATQSPLVLESFTTRVAAGGAVNCMQLTIWPHGNGTHTETVGHLLEEPPPIGALHPGYHIAALLSVEATSLGESTEHYPAPGAPEDRVLTRASLEEAFEAIETHELTPTALVIRTLPNDPEAKRTRTYQNPPYLTSEAMAWIRHEFGAEHLLIDLPSVDRESDLGKLSNHRTFWDVPEGRTRADADTRAHCTITEMILAQPALRDGVYALHIELPALLTDATPSRPILYDILDPDTTP